MKKILFTLFIILFSTNIALAAQKEDINIFRWYKIYWSGIHIADLKAEIKNGEFYTTIDSYGIVKSVSKYKSSTKTTFKYKGGEYIPVSFFNESKHRHGSRKIQIKYKNDGEILKEKVTPPDKRYKRPPVKNELKHSALDPLTAIVSARQKIKESLINNKSSFSINMYDGRRLASLDFNIVGRSKNKIKGKEHNVVTVTFKRSPIEGFTENELSRMEGEEPLFTIYLSDDEKLLPIKVDAEAPLGTAVLLFEKECSSWLDCV